MSLRRGAVRCCFCPKFMLALLIVVAGWVLSSGTALAQDSTPPALSSFDFSPTSINTTAAFSDVTAHFTASDVSGVAYFEIVFVSPSGATFLRASCSISPPVSPVTEANCPSPVTVRFPQYASPGDWPVAAVVVIDGVGNLTFLSDGSLPAGFQKVSVTSVKDTTPPDLTAFSFTPASIDTTSASKDVTVSFTAADTVPNPNPHNDTAASGVASFQVNFLSPSGSITQSATTSTSPATVTFPKFSEAGTWTVGSVIVTDNTRNNLFCTPAVCSAPNGVDADGNLIIVNTPGLTARGFSTTLTVTSTPDTTPPTLTSFSFTPTAVNVNSGPASVAVSFGATDGPTANPSGVTSFLAVFLSPSNSVALLASSTFAAVTPASGTPALIVPQGSEPGTWTVAFVYLTDAVGNTRLLDTSALNLLSFPTQFTITTGVIVDSTPPVIVPTVNPLPNGVGWNNTTPVTVTWGVADPESAITSMSGCGTTQINSPTTGMTVTCQATSAGGTNSVSVVVKIDTAAPVTSNVIATPDPLPVGGDLTITATVTDSGGSGVASAEYNVDGGPFDDLVATDGTFDSSTEGVTLTLPGTHPLLVQPGVHNICVRGTDFADNIGATECVVVAVHGLSGFTTGGGGTNSPAGADPQQPTASGPVTFGFNAKQLPGDTVPSGSLEFHYKVGSLDFKGSSYDFQVITGNEAQIQGTGTLNGTSVCKFLIDAWDNSFQPGNVDAFGLRIFNCDGGSGDRYTLPATPTTKGNIEIHP